MEHLTLKAVVTTTDQGVFEAVISTEAVDREKDVVRADAMVEALRKWNRPIPLAWNHGTNAEDIFGAIDSQSVKNVDGEVVASGEVDLESDTGREAWRSFKNRTIGFSFGYLILTAGKRKGGGRDITGLDVFEITATPTPMNNATRVLSTKAAPPTAEKLREDANRVQREAEEEQLPDVPPPPLDPEPTPDDLKKELLQVKARLAEAEETRKEPPRDPAELRKEASRVLRQDEKERLPAVPTGDPAPEPVKAESFLDQAEVDGAQTGLLKAVWTAAYINDLPDGAFLHIESGGTKDSDGKTTPRSLRHFPYKDADGNIDLPHLRNALARIPQSNLPASVKEELTRKAQRILDSQKASDRDAMDRKAKRVAREAEEERIPHVPDPEPTPQVNLETELQEVKTLLAEMREGLEDLKKKAERTAKEPRARAVDPLREQAEAVALEQASGGESLRKPPRKVTAKPPELLPLEELKQRTRDEILVHLSGDIT
jgi:HK97 family phage prohead protease